MLVDCGFENGTTCGGTLADPYGSTGKTLTADQDATAPLSPSNVLRSTLYYPSKSGGTELQYGATAPITEIYVGLWWRTNPEFSGNFIGSNKTFFVRGSGGGTNGVFYYAYRPGQTGSIYWTTQLPYNRDQCGSGPDIDLCYANVQPVPVMPGNWYRIEAYFKASSCDTCHDGTVRWWITPKGGTPVLAGNYSHFAYGPRVDRWVWSETWDGYGNGTGFTGDASHFIDHLHISAPNYVPSTPKIINDTLPSAQTGKQYAAYLRAANGAQPFSWTVFSGSMPMGLVLNKVTGIISGVPITPGRSDFTVKVVDSNIPALEATKTFTITVTGQSGISGNEKSSARPTSNNPNRLEYRRGVLFLTGIEASARPLQLNVYDLSGRKILEKKIAALDGNEIAIGGTLGNGVYVAQLISNQTSSVFRFSVLN